MLETGPGKVVGGSDCGHTRVKLRKIQWIRNETNLHNAQLAPPTLLEKQNPLARSVGRSFLFQKTNNAKDKKQIFLKFDSTSRQL